MCPAFPYINSLHLYTGPKRDVLQAVRSAEQQIHDAIASATGRGKSGVDSTQQEALERAVEQLERDGGVADPTAREDLLDGRCATWP